MRVRVVAGLWLLVGVVVWNGFFDLYVSRGATEYLRRQAEFELGRGPEPSMAQVMREASRDGAEAASLWAVVIVASGWLTVWLGLRSR